MRTIRLEDRLIEETKEFLKLNGMFRAGMSVTAVVRAGLSCLIYGTPNLSDGRAKAAKILAETSDEPLTSVRARVAKFIQTYDWSAVGKQDAFVPQQMREIIENADEEVSAELKLKVPQPTIRKVPRAKGTRKLPDRPPWKLMKRANFGDLLLSHPKHKLVTWAKDDPIKVRAVEAAFGNVPPSLHKGSKVYELAEELYEFFLRWQKEKGKGVD